MRVSTSAGSWVAGSMGLRGKTLPNILLSCYTLEKYKCSIDVFLINMTKLCIKIITHNLEIITEEVTLNTAYSGISIGGILLHNLNQTPHCTTYDRSCR